MRAKIGEFTLHIPNVCIREGRHAIKNKCRPRAEADALRRFLSWGASTGKIKEENVAVTRTVLDQYESSIKLELSRVDDRLGEMASLACIKMFALDDEMLDYATDLALEGIALDPHDQAILASILITARRLWDRGERNLSFCEIDGDLQPWDSEGRPKTLLRSLYDQAHVWVYSDFTLTHPPRPAGFK